MKMPAAFDPGIIAHLRGQGGTAGQGFLKEVLEAFLEDAPLRMDDLDAAIRCGNADWLVRSAHDLGGSAGRVGAAGLSLLCTELELQARWDGLRGAENAVTGIRSEYESVLAEAARLFRNVSPGMKAP